jgi:hypothetical protein
VVGELLAGEVGAPGQEYADLHHWESLRLAKPSVLPGCFANGLPAGEAAVLSATQDAPSAVACSSSSCSGPSAFRQSPQARADAGPQARAHGTNATSPASAMSASRTSESGI